MQWNEVRPQTSKSQNQRFTYNTCDRNLFVSLLVISYKIIFILSSNLLKL